MKLIGTIENCQINLYDNPTKIVYRAKAAIDDDGSNNIWHDPDWNPDTSLHYLGRPVDAASIPYIVVPPLILLSVKEIVLGCQAFVTYAGETTSAVVADIGPHKKLGEISVECARRILIPESPTRGGVESHIVDYVIIPGQAAVVDGITYPLQSIHRA